MRKGIQDMARAGLWSLVHHATYRWLWSFIPSFFVAIFVTREYIYSEELIGQIESLDVEHMKYIIPSIASVVVKAKTNLGRPVSPVWRSKEGEDPESGYLLFGDAKKNMIFRLDRLSHSVFARKPGRRDTEVPAGACESRPAYPGPTSLGVDARGGIIILACGSIFRLGSDGEKIAITPNFKGVPTDFIFFRDHIIFVQNEHLFEFEYGIGASEENPNTLPEIHEVVTPGAREIRGVTVSGSRMYVSDITEGGVRWLRYDIQALFENSGKDPIQEKNQNISVDFALENMTVFATELGLKESCLNHFVNATFCSEGRPKSLKIDTQGNVFVTAFGGIHIFNPTGSRVGTIWPGLGEVTDIAFGPNSLYFISNATLLRLDCHSCKAPRN